MTAETATRELLVELLGDFYGRGWVSGTGGGICGPADDGGLLLAPTGVHKERVRPDEFFIGRPERRASPSLAGTDRPPTERVQPDLLAWPTANAGRGASSTPMRLSAVLAGDLAASDGSDHIAIRDLEMLKGIPGVTNTDVHLVPVIRQHAARAGARRPARVGPRGSALRARHGPSSCATTAAYIWGADVLRGQAPHRGLPLPVRSRVARAIAPPSAARRRDRR